MRRFPLYQVDAFTTRKLAGNPAGVIGGAEHLSDSEMQAIARELNVSETAFILPPDGDDHEVRLRYFTPTVEVPSCGHATIAAHFVRATELGLDSRTVHHKIGIGVLPVDVVRHGDEVSIWMTQRRPSFGDILDGADEGRLLAALGVEKEDRDPRCPVQWVDTGNPKWIVGVASRGVLDGLRPDARALLEFHRQRPSGGVFVFCFGGDDPGIATHARMFAPQLGIPEDPVTGNGNGPLGAYLARHRLLERDGALLAFRSRQGEAMGRPGEVDVEVTLLDGEPVKVRVGGRAVVAFRSELTLP